MEVNRRKEIIKELARASVTIVKMLSMRPGSVFFGESIIKIRRSIHRYRQGRVKKPEVLLRRSKCFRNPLDCALCMKACPEGVFFVYPRNREPGKICDSYELIRGFVSRCTGCGSCIDACPWDALVFPPEQGSLNQKQ